MASAGTRSSALMSISLVLTGEFSCKELIDTQSKLCLPSPRQVNIVYPQRSVMTNVKEPLNEARVQSRLCLIEPATDRSAAPPPPTSELISASPRVRTGTHPSGIGGFL